MAAAPVVLDHEGTNLKIWIWPKILHQNVEQCAAHASKLHIQLDLVQEHNGAKNLLGFWLLNSFFVIYFLKTENSFEVTKYSK